jgi:hypothetical protein
MSLKRRHLFALPALAVVVAMLPSQAAAAPTVSVVTSGLDSPRGVAFFNGRLVVGEAGHGGSLCVPAGPTGEACLGNSSQISWVNTNNGSHTPLVTGLLSVSLGAEGTLGVSGLSAGENGLLAQISGTPQELPPTFALGQAEAGLLISVQPNGTWTGLAPVGAHDFNYTLQFPEPPGPGTQEHDSNPYGVLATDEGAYVADAGSNTLDIVNSEGGIKILLHDPFRFTFPNFPSDAVPTCVVKTDDGLLVGELSGRVLEVHGRTFTVINNPLFTHITGCTADDNGNVYFVNMFGSGAPFTPPPTSNFFIGNVVKYSVDSGNASVLAGGLQFPNMDVIGPDGNLYVSAGAICGTTPVAAPPCFGGTGRVLKITLPGGDEND